MKTFLGLLNPKKKLAQTDIHSLRYFVMKNKVIKTKTTKMLLFNTN